MDKQQLQPILNIYKERGETPLQALERVRAAYPEYTHTPLSYAGRLDPMAEGVLLVLAGDENKNREKYLGLDKEYEIKILLGFETDTCDVLGLVTHSHKNTKIFSHEEIQKAVQELVGTYEQEYPAYSSKPVAGKPLFQWAREGKLNDIHIPTKHITIHSAEFVETNTINAHELLTTIISDVKSVIGDFRQDDICRVWQENLKNYDEKYQIITVTIFCSSGTYARMFAKNIGTKLEIPACAYAIKRLKLGLFSVSKSERL